MNSDSSDKPIVLCLNHDQFNSDIVVLIEHSTRYRWMAVQNKDLRNGQKHWMPERLQDQYIYAYERGPDVDAAWRRAKQFGIDVIENVQKEGTLVAVMASNWDYWEEEGIRLACNELGIPFLVLQRECYICDVEANLTENFFHTYPIIPNVAGVAAASQSTLDVLEACKRVPRERLRLTGWPRFDQWFFPMEPMFDRPVVLMSYRRGYKAEEHFYEMLRIFHEAAERHPNVPFVLKAKHNAEVPHLEEVMRAYGSRVKCVSTHQMPSLLCNARVVAGYNSLSLYEGLLTDALILSPRWGQTNVDPRHLTPAPTDPRINEHIMFVESREEFDRLLDQAALAPVQPEVDLAARLKAFQSIFKFDTERLACAYVEDFVTEMVADFEKAARLIPAT